MVKAKAEKWDKEKTQAALDKIGDYPEPDGVSHTQADIMYTLPGDIVVYKQVVPDNVNADGHVDIRTYHGFVSDFMWPIMPKLGGIKRQGKQYRVIGVYRKVSDEMAMVRVKAFLRIVREHEAKGFDRPYHALLWDGKKHIVFSDFSGHPYNNGTNKPAGAYQIKKDTYKDALEATGWPGSFTPVDQDRAAIYLLQERKSPGADPKRTALGYIMEGKVEQAVNETKLWKLFAFLPGGDKQQQLNMDKLKQIFSTYVLEFSI